jgi:hypothetical protein
MSLRRVIKLATGEEIHICHACFECDVPLAEEMDIPLGSLVQLALLNDEEALNSRTLWSDAVLEASHGACKRGLNLPAVMAALRDESLRRMKPETSSTFYV